MFNIGEKIKSTKNGKTYVVTRPTKEGAKWVEVRSADMTVKRFTGALEITDHNFKKLY